MCRRWWSSSPLPLPDEGEGEEELWSDLPELLLQSIVLRLPHLSDVLCFSAVCRSWRRFLLLPASLSCGTPLLLPASLSCGPPLLLLPKPYPRFRSIDRSAADSIGVNPSIPKPNPSQAKRIIGLGYSHGHLILQLLPSRPHIRLVISDPFTGREILPPPPPRDKFPSIYYAAILSAPVSSPDSFLILFTNTSLVYHRLAKQCSPYYTVHPLADSFASSILPLKSGKTVYAINHEVNKLMEFSSSPNDDDNDDNDELGHVKIHDMPEHVDLRWRGFYKSFDGWHFGPQLAELDGELFMVLFVSNMGNGFGTHMRWLHVYKMDFDEMAWVAADYVMDKCALFVDTCGRCAVLVSEPERWGGSRSRLYLADQERNGCEEFALHDCLIIPEYGSPPLTTTVYEVMQPRWPAPVWVFPSFL